MSSALIVIDVQDSFLQQPIWAASSNPGIAQAGFEDARLLRRLRAASQRGPAAAAG
jgi:hypothetical protein